MNSPLPDSPAAGSASGPLDVATEASLRAEIAALRAELEQLRAAEHERDRLARILEASPDFIGIATPDGKAVFVNPAGQRILGREPDGEPLQDTIERVHPPWAKQLIVDHGIPTAIREGTWQGESALLDASGRERPVSQVIVAHRNEHGEVLYLSTIMRDIRELKQAESALMRSEQRYRTLVDTSPDAIFINQRGVFTYLNKAAVRLFGARSTQDLIGTPCLDRIHPDDRDAVRERIRVLIG
ncbi:PAS domain S-box protein, partial [Arthrospira platensis SPKY1]|nr:PAS domain S-box protein [Arthrospira platensis SPKY1]